MTVQSFDWRTLLEVKRLAPEIETSCLTVQTANMDTVKAADDGASPWHAGLSLRSHGGSMPALVKAAGCGTWSMFWRNLSADDVAAAHALGLKVLPWTVNERSDMSRLIDHGVDGIITDYPDRLRSADGREEDAAALNTESSGGRAHALTIVQLWTIVVIVCLGLLLATNSYHATPLLDRMPLPRRSRWRRLPPSASPVRRCAPFSVSPKHGSCRTTKPASCSAIRRGRPIFLWKKGGPGQLDRDTLERVSYVLGIYKALQILLPDAAAADAWVRKPNTAPLFGGKPALQRMLSGNVADLYVVRQYLDAWRGG